MPPLLEDSASAALPDTEKALEHGCQGPGYVPSRVVRRRYSGRTGDEILPIRGH
jgi:hypothetical protein